MGKLRVGVVGAGYIAVTKHVNSLKMIKAVELAAICDKQLPLAKNAATKFNVKGVYEDFDDMLSKEKLDVAVIVTPPATHSDMAIRAMNYGSHVLVEKPMAVSLHEADAMIETAKKNSVHLGVIWQNLFNPAVLKAKKLVDSGVLGDIIHVETRTSESVNSRFCTDKNHWCHKLPGGIFREIMPHPVYVAQFFLGDMKPVSVAARKLSRREYMKNDEVRVLVEGRNGFGTIFASCNSYIHGDTLDIFGSKIALHADITQRSVIIYKPHAQKAIPVALSNLRLSAQLLGVLGVTASTFIKTATGKTTHYFAINRFIQNLISDTEFAPTLKQARAAVCLLDQICAQL